ncbi:MAG: DUF11 domain-containing protein [Acidobacteriota bacterium]|nr:MAG: DUF11 domain-containing protein [Acidobacteriota bacterium]
MRIPNFTASLRVTLSILSLLGLLAFKSETRPVAYSPLPNLQGDAATGYLKGKGLYRSLGEAMAAARYSVWPLHPKTGREGDEQYSAGNPEQRYHTFFSPEEVRVVAKNAAAERQQLRLGLRGVGYGERLEPVAEAELHRSGRRIEYRRGGLTEWYVNDRQGLEQGFTLQRAPGERSGDERLRLALAVSGDLRASASKDGGTALLKDTSGAVVLRYSGLKVWDAGKRELPAGLVVSEDEIMIEVDDRDARYPVTIDPVISTQVAKIEASDKESGDQFGLSVSISGDTAIVGAPFEADPGGNSGAAYIFERNQGGANMWGEVKKLEASDKEGGDQFGLSVSISGDTAIVGARFEDDPGSASGAAYIYERNQGGANNWGEVKKLEASDKQDGDLFGWSASISGDTAIVGAVGEDDPLSASGAAYIFERNQGGANNWGEVRKIEASDKEGGDQFGHSVSMSGDTAIVGTRFEADPGGNSGAAYIFERNQGGANNWGEVRKIEASDKESGDQFGHSVSISGDTVIVGALFEADPGGNSGAAYIFARNQGGADNWGEVKKIEASDKESGDQFGSSVSISGDTAIVGAPFEADPGGGSGAAYIFARNQGGADNWGEVKKIEASDKEGGDQFSLSVSISGDTAIVSAPFEDDPGNNSGAAYLFVNICNDWKEAAKSKASDKEGGDEFGYSVSISGDTAIVGAPFEADPGTESGAAYIFARNQGGANMWGEVRKIEASDKESDDQFGFSVSISGDTAIVGANLEFDPGINSGAAYIFERNQGGADNWGEVKKLEASDKDTGDQFGYSVSISGDMAIVGAVFEDDPGNASGAAYIFARNQGGSNNWGEVKKIEASDKESGDFFGWSVSMSGDTAIVGANLEYDPGINSGAAYIFERNQGGADNWGEVKKIEASDKESGDQFGWSVSMSGDTAIVGAVGEDDPGNESGAAYIFERNQGGANNWGEVKKLEASDKEAFDQFGYSVSISGDMAIVGAVFETDPGGDSGAAYIFERNQGGANNWGEVKKVEASDREPGDQFGKSVSISGDTAIVGAVGEADPGFASGAAYLFSIKCEADLAVTKSGSPGPDVFAGNNITYTVGVINNGPDSAANVTVTDAVPANTTFVSASLTSGSGWAISAPSAGGTGNVVFSKATMANAETATFEIVVKVDDTAANGATITNQAIVDSGILDPDLSNNTAVEMTNVLAPADLAVTKSGSPSPNVSPGSNITYTINFINNGPATATNVVVSDPLPTETTFVSASVTSGTGWTITPPSMDPSSWGPSSYRFSKGSVAAGETAVFTFVVRVNNGLPNGYVITNRATATSSTPDTVTGNNTGVATTTVSGPPPPASPQQAIENLIDDVEDLIPPLTQNQGNNLISKLNAALNYLNQGKKSRACNQLQSFINQVNNFINNGKLTPGQGQPLINAAVAIKQSIGC